MEIYLIRHTTPAIEKGICYGQTDIGLSAELESCAAKIIHSLPSDVNAIYSSPLKRCTFLADLLPYSVRVQTDFRLLELNFGDWEMKKWDDISPHEPWFSDYIYAKVPGGESYYQLYKRVSEFFNNIIDLNIEKVVVITHAGVIKAAISSLRRISLEESLKAEVEYGSVHHFIL